MKMLDTKTIAEKLGLTANTIVSWANEGTIPAYRLGSSWRFDEAEIDAWLEDQKNTKAVTI